MTKNYKASYFLSLIIIVLLLSIYPKNSNGQGNDNKVKKIVLDAGHGGKDPGALGKKTKEKNLTLGITLKVGKYITENIPGVDVVYTRKNDVFVELDKRADIANKENADIFISIHINSCKDKKAYGTSTYVSGLAKNQETTELANLENSVITNENDYKNKYSDILDNSNENYIVNSLYQNIHLTQSLNLASYIQNQFGKRAGRKDRGVKQANFVVLKRTTMPSVLIECGFISNVNEENYMNTDEGQAIIASAIYRAVKQYKNELEGGNLNLNSDAKSKKDDKPNTKKDDKINNKTDLKLDKNNNSNNNKGVCLKVQLKSSTERIPLNSNIFKGIQNVEELKIDGVYKYTVGCEKDMQKITQLQTEIRKKIPDAFVIAIKDGKRIDINTAKKELGIK
ncbi:MAG: N-acetylmuramoyl-L-alanine amidase [Bacteroidales bacterium]|nr:N-acetylmuramoyl-L-alanine amidase [Bacteroidales bacterium]